MRGGILARGSHWGTDSNWVGTKTKRSEQPGPPDASLKALISLTKGARIDWRGYSEVQELIVPDAPLIFLGIADDVCHFAVDASAIENPKRPPNEDWGKFIDVRSVAPQLSSGEAGALAQARSMIDWHNRHGFCAVCGTHTQSQEAGYSRKCEDTTCNATHFPRTDPVAIMMVTRGDKCLLGQGINFPGDFYSCLAGFIEPGETIEQGVRREVMEESGIQTGDVRYHQSQPWPFPSSLMIGCFAEALTEEITVDRTELNDARWFSREEVRMMLEQSTKPTGLRIGGPIALAHQLAKAWVEQTTPVA